MHLLGVVIEAVVRVRLAAAPMALLSFGASVNWRVLPCMDRFEAALNANKLLLLPAATLFVATLLGVGPGPGPSLALTIFAALPTASTAHVLASVDGADSEQVAKVIAKSTLIRCMTLPLWLLALLCADAHRVLHRPLHRMLHTRSRSPPACC